MARKNGHGRDGQDQNLQHNLIYQATVTGDVSKLQKLLKDCNSSDRRRLLSTSLLAAVLHGVDKAGGVDPAKNFGTALLLGSLATAELRGNLHLKERVASSTPLQVAMLCHRPRIFKLLFAATAAASSCPEPDELAYSYLQALAPSHDIEAVLEVLQALLDGVQDYEPRHITIFFALLAMLEQTYWDLAAAFLRQHAPLTSTTSKLA